MTRHASRARARALDRARALYRDLAKASDLFRARDRDRDLAKASDLDLARDRALHLALDLDRILDPARDLDRDNFDLDLDRGVDLARDLARLLHRARDRAHDLDLDLDRGVDLARGDGLADVLDRGLRHALSLASDLDNAGGAAARGREGRGIHAAGPAVRVAGAAARLLPARERARYGEEFRSELFELAAAGEPRRRQVLYAVRLLRTAPALRAGLRAPRRRKAGP